MEKISQKISYHNNITQRKKEKEKLLPHPPTQSLGGRSDIEPGLITCS